MTDRTAAAETEGAYLDAQARKIAERLADLGPALAEAKANRAADRERDAAWEAGIARARARVTPELDAVLSDLAEWARPLVGMLERFQAARAAATAELTGLRPPPGAFVATEIGTLLQGHPLFRYLGFLGQFPNPATKEVP